MTTGEHEAILQAIKETRQQVHHNLKRFESNMADILMGPETSNFPDEMPPPGTPGGGWWGEQFEKNWPPGRKRKRWLPLGVRR